MGHNHPASVSPEQVSVPPDSLIGKLGVPFILIGLALIGLTWFVIEPDAETFSFKYLTSFMFWLSVALGGLFFTLIHHATRAGWSTVLRRLAENYMILLPAFVVLFIPVVMNLHTGVFYEWTETAHMAEAGHPDAMLEWKAPYLNETFFYVRAAILFGLWSFFAVYYYRLSTRHDTEGGEALVHKQRWLAPLGILLFALSLTVAAIDWMMSLDPHFFSTIFGVYYFAGTFITINAVLVVTSAALQKAGLMEDVITTEHYHDMGKYIFAFVVFWTYIAFSQYFLIWYANIPEETYWFAYRWEACAAIDHCTLEQVVDAFVTSDNRSSWAYVSMFQVVGHFVVPFFLLMSRHIKRHKTLIVLGAIYMLVVHYIDMYWLIQPVQDYLHHVHHGAVGPMHGVHPSLTDLTSFLGIGFVVVGGFLMALKSKSTVPLKDPRLSESLVFENFPQ